MPRIAGESRIDAVVGGHDQQIVGAQPDQPFRQLGVDRAQGAVKAGGVLAMTVDLVGLDQVDEDKAPIELRQQRASVRQGTRVGRTGMGPADPGARAGRRWVGDAPAARGRPGSRAPARTTQRDHLGVAHAIPLRHVGHPQRTGVSAGVVLVSISACSPCSGAPSPDSARTARRASDSATST